MVNKEMINSNVQTLNKNLNLVLEKLTGYMNEFISNIHGFSACLLTEDGLIIAEGINSKNKKKLSSEDLAAITASMISIAEQAVLHYRSGKKLAQFTIETINLDNPKEGGLNIFAFQIHPNVLLAYNFPSSIPKGLVSFELSNIIKNMQEIIFENESTIMRNIGSMI